MQHVIETQNVPIDRLWLWRSRCTSLVYLRSEERCQGSSTRWTSRHSRAAAAVTSWSARMSEPDQEDSPTTEIPLPPDAAPHKPTNKYVLVSTIFHTLARKTPWMWVQPADVAVIKWFWGWLCRDHNSLLSPTCCIAICRNTDFSFPRTKGPYAKLPMGNFRSRYLSFLGFFRPFVPGMAYILGPYEQFSKCRKH